MKINLLALFLLFSLTDAQVLRWLLGLTKDDIPEEKSRETSTMTDEEDKRSPISDRGAALPGSHIPYEVPIESDETFLAEAKKLLSSETEITSLDLCLHEVVLHLKASCARLNEDDLSRFSIQLMNCQAAYEGRRVFPCTDRMTLRDCTSHMDGDTWNAYQLFAVRARAVCTVIRQQQFKLLTEIAVNKLMAASKDQLDSMAELQSKQETLRHSVDDAVEAVTSGNEKLLSQQNILLNGQEMVRDIVAGNLDQLVKEKALISSGQNEMATLLEILKSKIDTSLHELTSQNELQRNNHHEVIADLRTFGETISFLQSELTSGLARVLAQQVTSGKMQDDTLDSLVVINQTVNYLSEIAVKSKIQLDWIERFLAIAGKDVHATKAWASHAGYLVAGMLSLSFLRAPLITRLALLTVLPVNLTAELADQESLDWKGLVFLLTTVSLVYWLYRGVSPLFYKKPKVTEPRQKRLEEKNSSLTPERHFTFRSCDLPLRRPSIHDDVTQLNSTLISENPAERLLSGSFRVRPVQGIDDRSISTYTPRITRGNNTQGSVLHERLTPSISSMGTPSRRAATSNFCGAITRSGAPCKNHAPRGDFCYRHENGAQSVIGDYDAAL